MKPSLNALLLLILIALPQPGRLVVFQPCGGGTVERAKANCGHSICVPSAAGVNTSSADLPGTKHAKLEPDFGVTGTFSICAVDPQTGICGAAVASLYPAVGTVVPFARGGVGAFCTQHWLIKGAGPRALDLLAAGKLPEEVLLELIKDDPREGKRQLGIVDVQGRTASRNCYQADPDGWYYGSMSGRFYTCQGNTLTGREVIEAMSRAYEQTKGSLADRLMAALIAGDCAGGDHRGRLSAGIRVSKPGQEDYWLELQTDKSVDAVVDLLKKYVELDHPAKGEWRGGEIPFEHPCKDRPAPKAPPLPE